MNKEKIHFLGICGTFMGGLALLARDRGYEVSGCDANIYPPMSKILEDQKINLVQGYDLDDLPDVDLYIIGNALSRGNPLIEFLLDNKKEFLSGPEWMAKNILHDRKVLAISGTHGKTTTTSMCSWILDYTGIDAGFLIAGKPKNFDSSSRLGSHEIFIIEADEYDTAFFDKRAKFVHYNPEILVINNLEFDHADIYKDIGSIQTQFHHLIRTMPSKGHILFPENDENIQEVISQGSWSNIVTYGDQKISDWNYKAVNEDFSIFEISFKDKIQEVDWSLIGEYNAQNALVSVMACKELGVPIKNSCEALSTFKGVDRRLDLIYQDNNISIYDDFAHHPTAIRKTLKSLKSKYPNSRIISLIELGSNTMRSGLHDEELNNSIIDSDLVFWKSKNFDQEDRLIKENKSKCKKIKDNEEFIASFVSELKNGDIVVFMSNGNFSSLGNRIINRLN
ncbi:MAG: UDP-N-acetylmuramate:L-alanyl-gamma-D-glutamyl-meso-diaminopimelate ligase [SAR86 cluster bacterium]|nr:UDP-N-acetylmuramate:L-alanyl-gamma-D-glutamyl-meso-diaminopimelate ligase [SAR86 cluster bacterium]